MKKIIMSSLFLLTIAFQIDALQTLKIINLTSWKLSLNCEYAQEIKEISLDSYNENSFLHIAQLSRIPDIKKLTLKSSFLGIETTEREIDLTQARDLLKKDPLYNVMLFIMSSKYTTSWNFHFQLYLK